MSYGPRLRTRGGATLRKRWTRIVSMLRRPHKCPRCSSPKVKRLSVGIWRCRKCGFTFAGGAYQPQTKLGKLAAR
ncbi:50S ribosomal protein L37ae [Candidatus Bathyarchaeota archaeon]|nr:MAG: 50S ribosomal protein L37ae [Candidatus Bathyarchaeota archaeon]RLI18805.1 MAG: 50S ribosomal protein L37ae [Candidatus Bathyarchaeota archaeon]